MSETITISHAYNGFIYLPLFLAKYLGYFPQGVELHFSDGDETAIREVLQVSNKNNKFSDFAICDPLIVGDFEDLMGEKEVGEPDPPIIVGSLIKRTPVWLFNTNPEYKPVPREESLKGLIRKIRCYEKPNTGYLIGRRLQKIIEIPDDLEHYKEVKFNQEFDSRLSPNEIVITSNVLKMGEIGFNDNNIIFSYATKETDIKEAFFTGVVTRKSIFDTDLPLVLAILRGLKKAIEKIYFDDIDHISAISYKILKDDIKNYRLMVNPTEKNIKKVIKNSIEHLIREERIYSSNLEIGKEDWEASIKLRKEAIPTWQPPSYDVFTEEIPVILIQSGWQENMKRKLCNEDSEKSETKKKAILNQPPKRWYHDHAASLLTLLYLPAFCFSVFKVFQSYQSPNILPVQNFMLLSLTILFFGSLAILGGHIIKELSNDRIEKFSSLATWWAVIYGFALGTSFSGLELPSRASQQQNTLYENKIIQPADTLKTLPSQSQEKKPLEETTKK